jgi:hypothetical protein
VNDEPAPRIRKRKSDNPFPNRKAAGNRNEPSLAPEQNKSRHAVKRDG